MPVGKSELAIFDRVSGQTVIERGNLVEYSPITSISQDSPIEFKISSDQYLDLSESLLYVRFRLDQGVGYKTAPINNILSSAFADIEVIFGDRVVETTNHLYPYKSLFTILLNYSADAKNASLVTSGYVEDEAGKMNDVANKGFVVRQEMTQRDFIGPLWLDTFAQTRLIVPNVGIRLKFTPSKSNFCLQTFRDEAITVGVTRPKLSIEECKVYVRNVSVNPAVRLAHEIGLKRENAIYPIQRNEMKNFVVSKGLSNISLDNIFNQKVPKMIVFAMVDNKAFNGEVKLNPFNFHHFDCNFIGLYKDGTAISHRELTPNFANKRCVREYVALLKSLNMFGKNLTNSISLEEYMNGGYNLFAFNLAADLSYASRQPAQMGNIRLELQFAKALPDPINIIFLAIFDDEIEITESRQIIT